MTDAALAATTLAVIVTYNPDPVLLEAGLGALADQFSTIALVDNCSTQPEYLESLAARFHAIFLRNEANLGIAAALNIAFQLASEHGFEWVICVDQDTVIPPNLSSAYSSYLSAATASQVAMICPNFRSRKTGKVEFEARGEPNDVDRCITSGSLCRTSSWLEVGGFDEIMFIDGVDFDFCKRIRMHGFRVVMLTSVILEHEIGDSSVYSLLGRSITIFRHSAFRKYFIAQNIIYISGKYRSGRASPLAYAKVARQIALVLVYEDDKRAKLASLIAGARAGHDLLRGIRASQLGHSRPA